MKIRRAAMVKKLTSSLTAKKSLKRYLFTNSTLIYIVKKISRRSSPRRATFKKFLAALCPEGIIKTKNLFHYESDIKLMEISKSVCLVSINGKAEGTGFLLFDRFVLTNCHVINNVLDKRTGQLCDKVIVHFLIKSLEEVIHVEVEEVVGFEFDCNESERKYDWALLRLAADVKLPCLLNYFGFLPKSGGIYIIGHPGCGVKQIDATDCFIIPTTNVNRFTPDSIVWYKTYFSHGSSGSPVFDEHGNVVAIHSGGDCYGKAKGERLSAYGYLLSNVITRIVVQAVERNRFDVLKKYLSYDNTKTQELMHDMKTLYESRNSAGVQDYLHSPEVTNDESLMEFLDFICGTPQPMEIDLIHPPLFYF